MQSITIKQVNQYGSTVFKPSCTTSQLFAKLAGTKTLTIDALKTIKELGYSIEVQADTVKF